MLVEEKKQRQNLKLLPRMAEVQIGIWTPIPGGNLYSKIGSNQSAELHMCENHVFFLSVNILTVWHVSFLGRTAHYHVS